VMVKAISATDRWNSVAIVGRQDETSTKKSKASMVQTEKLASSVWVASERVRADGDFAGGGGGAHGGSFIIDALGGEKALRVGRRVARHRALRLAHRDGPAGCTGQVYLRRGG
jgi:hypothetical protein